MLIKRLLASFGWESKFEYQIFKYLERKQVKAQPKEFRSSYPIEKHKQLNIFVIIIALAMKKCLINISFL